MKLRDDLIEDIEDIFETSIISLGSHIFVSIVEEACAEMGHDQDFWYHKAFCWVYDCLADKWETVVPMPTVRRLGHVVGLEDPVLLNEPPNRALLYVAAFWRGGDN